MYLRYSNIIGILEIIKIKIPPKKVVIMLEVNLDIVELIVFSYMVFSLGRLFQNLTKKDWDMGGFTCPNLRSQNDKINKLKC